MSTVCLWFRDLFSDIDKTNLVSMFLKSAFFRDLLLPDGNRVSAFSVASTAIAAAQWSSSQVGLFSVEAKRFILSVSLA